ncbi:hypothetical protein [Bradyrhizobium sp. BR 1433]|uniref:hypothetical protein n=1 Tax=Bradyrhizobium sp. BR 1433 TaxID=3447967 RepID=UPI003EE5418B
MSTATLRDENERMKALLAQTQAALSEHQAALATSEEALRRMEVILGNYAERSSERSPKSCGQINIICRSKTWRLHKASCTGEGCGGHQGPIACWIGSGPSSQSGLLACPFAAGRADPRACEHVLSVRLRRDDEDRRGRQQAS